MRATRHNIAIVGGTGFDRLPGDIFAEEVTVETRFGTGSALSVSFNYVEPSRLYFIPRHGAGHRTPPHEIDYRLLIATAQELDAQYLFATNAVGSIRSELPPGSLLLPNDFIDFTRARPPTFFQPGGEWRHVDLTVPYSPLLRQSIKAAAEDLGVTVTDGGVYFCCDGPRFETPAEIRTFRSWGADVIGMTGVPEVVFAREAGLQYAALAVVTNMAAGLSAEPVDHAENVRVMSSLFDTVRELLFGASTILAGQFTPE